MLAAKPLNVPLKPSVRMIRINMSSSCHRRALRLVVRFELLAGGGGPPLSLGSACSRVFTVSNGYTTLSYQLNQCEHRTRSTHAFEKHAPSAPARADPTGVKA
jgi:hypothetical protein